jgi:hypothetical protein
MARAFERAILKQELAKAKMELLEPEYLIIHQEHDIVCKNRFGNIVTFSFDEVWDAIYNEEAIGCSGNCERCLTPIC